jgi:hypothetical protein
MGKSQEEAEAAPYGFTESIFHCVIDKWGRFCSNTVHNLSRCISEVTQAEERGGGICRKNTIWSFLLVAIIYLIRR